MKVAIKKIDLSKMWNRQGMRAVIREIFILRKLSKTKSNKFTVRLIDVVLPTPSLNKETPVIYLVMSLADLSLNDLLSSGEVEWSEEHLTIMVYNILCAVNYLNTSGIIHRDIKPSNILVNADCTIKICDFGWSRTVKQKAKGASSFMKPRPMTPTCCTRFYRPPEVILDSGYDAKVDSWGIGASIAELVLKFLNQGKKHLFSGNSCYPITPFHGEIEERNKTALQGVHKDDQLLKIIEVLGH